MILKKSIRGKLPFERMQSWGSISVKRTLPPRSPSWKLPLRAVQFSLKERASHLRRIRPKFKSWRLKLRKIATNSALKLQESAKTSKTKSLTSKPLKLKRKTFSDSLTQSVLKWKMSNKSALRLSQSRKEWLISTVLSSDNRLKSWKRIRPTKSKF